MAPRTTQHTFFTLALLASAVAIPMMPYSMGMMGLGGMLGYKAMMGHGNTPAGATYKPGSIHSATRNGVPLHTRADRLTSSHRRLSDAATGLVLEGMRIVITPTGHDANPQTGSMPGGLMGALYPGGTLGFGGTMGYLGAGHGLLGSLYGMGGSHAEQLEADIEIVLPTNVTPFERVLVFTELAEQGIPNTIGQCAVEHQGTVLTEPVSDHSHGFLGGHGFGGSMNMLGGYMGGHGMEPDFGVMATLALQGGSNTFHIKGLGPFQRLEQLAGRGVALCQNVVIGADGRPVCTGDGDIPVSFCGTLGYSNQDRRLV